MTCFESFGVLCDATTKAVTEAEAFAMLYDHCYSLCHCVLLCVLLLADVLSTPLGCGDEGHFWWEALRKISYWTSESQRFCLRSWLLMSTVLTSHVDLCCSFLNVTQTFIFSLSYTKSPSFWKMIRAQIEMLSSPMDILTTISHSKKRCNTHLQHNLYDMKKTAILTRKLTQKNRASSFLQDVPPPT